ncbi:hypothetical protein K432DRAFT_9004 [Lepidopterella palustris CBS 459.81]|uniref:Heterokaryon incompatibility domain-containing protein n=1 Tax=Lepidopterella palustris CBS 459.81 TaxID=1314670 RepID=A0A8E2DX83_9PEZI|nr:hypothetical protein K432DRAFT_9004 [Lepidopterella palustris CBS 459.81]
MDHLPLPSDSIPPAIEIPFISKSLYDGEPFDDYPLRQGIAIDRSIGSINMSTFFERPFKEQTSFVQTWLYFGLLQQFFGPLFFLDNFCCLNSNGVMVITTKQLQNLLEKWDFHRKNKSAIEIPNREKLGRIFRTACSAFELFNQKNESTLREPFPAILLSIDILLTTLLLFTDLDYTRESMDANPFHHLVPSTSILYNHMIQNGWCCHQLQHLFPRLSCCTLYFLASLRRHQRSPSEHQGCLTEATCLAHNIKEEEFHTRHIAPNCDCSFVPAPVDDMTKILERGEIPLLSWAKGNSGQFELSYVEATPGKRYIAISHLWADGLGNTHANQLPHCQMEKLVSRAQSIPIEAAIVMKEPLSRTPRYRAGRGSGDGHFTSLLDALGSTLSILYHESFELLLNKGKMETPLYLWIDAYCVPVIPSKRHGVMGNGTAICDNLAEAITTAENLKSKAISLMTPTYAGAEAVLILDQEIQSTPSSVSVEEILARILVSGWKGRYWTQQEASLAMARSYQLKDSLYNWDLFPEAESMRRLDSNRRRQNTTATTLDLIFNELLDHCDDLSRPGFLFKATFGKDCRIKGNKYREHYKHEDGNERDRQFVWVWNSLQDKTSTKRRDIHCILANMLDFSAKEILTFPDRHRMKAIIGSYHRLPVHLLFSSATRSWYNEGSRQLVGPDDRDRWLPQLPGGIPLPIIMEDKLAKVTGQGLTIEIKNNWPGEGLKAYKLHNIEVPTAKRFALLDTVTRRKLWVELQCDDLENPPNVRPVEICLLLDYTPRPNTPWARGYIGLGARFAVLNRDQNTLQVIFDRPLAFGRWECVCADPDFATAPVVEGALDECNPTIWIECDIDSWYKPCNRRPGDGGRIESKLMDGAWTLVFLAEFVVIVTMLVGYLTWVLCFYITLLAVFAFMTALFVRSAQMVLWRHSFRDDYDTSQHWWIRLGKALPPPPSYLHLWVLVWVMKGVSWVLYHFDDCYPVNKQD